MTRRSALPYLALCLVAGSGWILEQALPRALPGALGLLVENAILALLFAFSLRPLSSPVPETAAHLAVIFGVPPALVLLSDGHLSSTTIVLVYAIVPVVTAFFFAQLEQTDLLAHLGPALAGLMGAALILPFDLPSSRSGQLWLAATLISAALAGFSAVRVRPLLSGLPLIPPAALACFATALFALPIYLVQRPAPLLLSWQQAAFSSSVYLVVDAATLLLTIRLLRDLPPIAASTRYFIIPFVTILEGYAILRPHASWSLAAGLALLAGGSALLLRGDRGERQT